MRGEPEGRFHDAITQATLTVSHKKVAGVLLSFVGTTIEWYDFLIYSTAAALAIGPQFFSVASAFASALAAVATFAVGLSCGDRRIVLPNCEAMNPAPCRFSLGQGCANIVFVEQYNDRLQMFELIYPCGTWHRRACACSRPRLPIYQYEGDFITWKESAFPAGPATSRNRSSTAEPSDRRRVLSLCTSRCGTRRCPRVKTGPSQAWGLPRHGAVLGVDGTAGENMGA